MSTWFANARRRMKKALSEEEDVKSSSSPCSSPGYNDASSPPDSPQECVPTTVSASSIVHVISSQSRDTIQGILEAYIWLVHA